MDSHGEACFAGSAKTAGLFRFLRIESSGNFDERPADKAQLRNSELRGRKASLRATNAQPGTRAVRRQVATKRGTMTYVYRGNAYRQQDRSYKHLLGLILAPCRLPLLTILLSSSRLRFMGVRE